MPPSVDARSPAVQATTTATRAPQIPTDTPSLVQLPIDARRVLAASGSGCTGGPMGGEADRTWSYDVWTLHCPAGSDAAAGPGSLVDAFKSELELLGATLLDEGEIVTFNPGNSGDQQVQLHGTFEGVDLKIRITYLKAGDGSVMVITVDQRKE